MPHELFITLLVACDDINFAVSSGTPAVVIGFRQEEYQVSENSTSGFIVLSIDVLQGSIDQGETVLVDFTTEDGTASGRL